MRNVYLQSQSGESSRNDIDISRDFFNKLNTEWRNHKQLTTEHTLGVVTCNVCGARMRSMYRNINGGDIQYIIPKITQHHFEAHNILPDMNTLYKINDILDKEFTTN